MSKKRILLLTPDYPPNRGGVARYLSDAKTFFQDQMRVISPSEETLSWKYIWPHWLKSLWICVREKQTYDVVLVSHVLPFGTAAFLASWFTHKPYLVITHGMDIRLGKQSSWKRFLLRQILNKALCVIANSQSLDQELQQAFGVKKSMVIYPCLVSVSSFQKSPTNKFHLLTVGRLVARKGHVRVLTMLSKLKQRHPDWSVRYDIVGSGPMETVIRKKISELHLDQIVVLHTDIENEQLESFYQSADMFVMPVVDDPVDKEGFGLVFLEAASFGVPSISTNMSGIDEAIIDGETGVLVKTEDELFDSVVELFEDQTKRLQLGNQARERVASTFLCDQQWNKLKEFLDS